MKDLLGTLVSFQKKDLAHLNDGQLKILCVFPHIMNRLKVLETQVYSHMNVMQDESIDIAKREVAICGFLEAIILMAGELKEAYEAIQHCYYRTQLAKSMKSLLPDDIQERLKRLPRHFSGDSLVHFLRNNFAYHNSPDTALQTIKILDDDTSMAFYFLDQGANIYFQFATNIRIVALAEWMGIDDCHDAVGALMPEVMGKVFNDVWLPMFVLVRDVLNTFKQEITPVHLTAVPLESELRAAVFYHMHE